MKRATRLSKLLLTGCLLGVASCAAEESTTPGDEPTAGIIRLNIDNSQLSIDQSGNVMGGPVVLRAGIGVTVTATFLTVIGEAETRVTPAVYQLNIVPLASGSSGTLTFTRSTTNPFSGTLVSNTPNVSPHVLVSLYNLEKQHDTWGPFEIGLQVSN